MELFYYSVPGFILSVIAFQMEKPRIALLFLFLSGFIVYLSGALLDPFLNLWDERFHALVAKNMMDHPFKPMLYADPVLDMAYDRWDRYHIWLHKQPLFLWQIALSFKLFGASELTLRLPNVIMSSLMVLFTFRTGKLMVNRYVGFYSALFMASSYYLMELVSGRQELEHNDVAFTFYISASIWSWIEYVFAGSGKKKYWIILTGLFSSFAILCKWLPGLLIFSGWGIYILTNHNFRLKNLHVQVFRDLLISFTITVFISAPWQIYTWIQFPLEKALEMDIYSKHLWIVLEGHGGDFWFHFQQMELLFGKYLPYFIPPSLFMLYKLSEKKAASISLIFMLVFVYLFYSVAKTKMPSFTYITVMIVFVSFGSLIFFLSEKLNLLLKYKIIQKLVLSFGILYLVWFNLNLNTLKENHKKDSQLAIILVENKSIFQELKNSLPENSVIFNVYGRHYIECMFYTGFTSYNIIPDPVQIDALKNAGRLPVIFDNGALPDYILNDNEILLIDKKISGWE